MNRDLLVEAELTNDNILLPHLLNLTSNLIILVNNDNCIAYINPSTEETFKLPKTDTIGQSYNKFCTETKCINLISKYQQTLHDTSSVVNVEEFLNSINTWIKWSITKLSFNPIRYLILGENITDKKTPQKISVETDDLWPKIDSKTEKNSKKYKDLLLNLPGSVFWKDIDSNYMGCNINHAKILGLKSPKDIIGKTDYDLFRPEEAINFIKNDQNVIKNKIHISVEEKGTISDGQQIPVLTNKAPLFNKEGNVVGVLGISLDIINFTEAYKSLQFSKQQTELEYENKKKILAKLSEKVTGLSTSKEKSMEDYAISMKNYLENIIDQMPGSVFWKDKNGVYLGANQGLAELTGLDSIKQIIGKTDYELPWKEGADGLVENDKRIMNQGIMEKVEESVILPNGEYVTYITHKVPLFNDENDESIGILGISLDITETKKAQAALKIAKETAESASKAKSEFLANMSHDLRAPLHGILGMADILKSQPHTEEQDEYISILQNAGSNLLELIEDLLNYSEVENESKHIVGNDFDIGKLFDETATLFQSQVEQKQLGFVHKNKIPPNTHIQSQSKAIKRIVSNLLNNALKFTEIGKITLLEKIVLKKDKKPHLFIQIKDTGIGIPKQNLKTIFEKFSKVTPSFEGKYKGVGLGLAIVNQFVETLGGTIEVKSRLGKGTIFTVQLPITYTQQSTEEIEQPENVADDILETIQGLKLNVLVIEDDKISQQFASFILNKLHCKVTVASNGTEALTKLKSKYDLIFSDIGLPDISGVEVAKHIRANKSTNRETTLIALTGHAAEQDSEACLNVGFNEVLQKPLSMEGFQQAIAKWVLNQ